MGSQLLAVEVRGAPLHSLPLQELSCNPDLQELEEVPTQSSLLENRQRGSSNCVQV